MNELVTYKTYEQFKVALDTEILSAAESFVKIGWLLKQARDTSILSESGYANLYEFAKAEYGIDKGTVSRYIAINDRFSVNGNSPVLIDKYSGRGVAKLQEMLTMSDEVIDVIPEQTTKSEIQEIKRDIKLEEEKTDIEVMLEEKDLQAKEFNLNNMSKQALYYYLRTDKEAFKRVCEAFEGSYMNPQEQIMKALAPSGVATPRTRVPQVGTILMSIQGLDHEMQFVNVRTNERESRPWLYIWDTLYTWFGLEISATQTSAAELYEEVYGEIFEEVAPVQPEEKKVEEEQVTKEKETKIQEDASVTNEESKTISVEVVPGVEVEIEQSAVLEEKKAMIEAAPNRCEEEQKVSQEICVEAPSEAEEKDREEGKDERTYNVTNDDHMRFVAMAESIKDELYKQDYKEASFMARKLADMIDLTKEEE